MIQVSQRITINNDYRARYYDSHTGRFKTKDPIGFAGGINQYSYVQNNPVNMVDPFGLDSVGCDSIPSSLETPCRLECCAKHDECYYKNKCTAGSWLQGCPKPECLKCNDEVSDCFVKCRFSKKDDPLKPNYFCAKLGRYITIPKDFPNYKAARKFCQN